MKRRNFGFHFGGGDAHLLGHLELGRAFLREELVQRRIEQPDSHGLAGHRLEYAGEVFPLEGQELSESGLALFFRVRHYHPAHPEDAIRRKEHVLGAAQAYALCFELEGLLRIAGCVGVRANFHLAEFVGPRKNRFQIA